MASRCKRLFGALLVIASALSEGLEKKGVTGPGICLCSCDGLPCSVALCLHEMKSGILVKGCICLFVHCDVLTAV